MPTNRRDEFDRAALDKLESNLAVVLTESGNKLRNEAGCDRRKKPDADDAVTAASDHANISDGIFNLRQRTSRPLDEILSGLRGKNAGAPPDEKAGTERVFQIPDLPADRRFPHAELGGSSSEAPFLGGRHDKAKMPNLDVAFRHGHDRFVGDLG